MTDLARSFEDGALAGGSPRLHDLLRQLARPARFQAGQAVFEQGDEGDAIYAVIEGEVEINLFSYSGRKLVLNALRPGAVFGEIALFDSGPRTAGATAKTDAMLACVRRSELSEAIAASPELAADLLHLAGQRLRWISQQFEDLSFLPLETRVARRLLWLVEQSASPGATVEISQAELADHVGATREAVSKILSLWKQHGLVEMGRGWIRIDDRTGLVDLAWTGF